MKQHKNRLDRLERRLPADDDGEIIVIRLSWGDEPDPAFPPVVMRRSHGGHLIRKIGIDTVPSHLRGPAGDLGKDDDGERQKTNRSQR